MMATRVTPPPVAATEIVKLPVTLLPADTVSVVRVVRSAERTSVLFAIETLRPGGDTVQVRETEPANEFTLVALMLDVPVEP